MLSFAQPLATTKVAKIIQEETASAYASKAIISGIKPCQKAVVARPSDKILVMSATTSPADLISHMPVLAEKNAVPYIFVADNTFINGFTCVMLPMDASNKNTKLVLKEAVVISS